MADDSPLVRVCACLRERASVREGLLVAEIAAQAWLPTRQTYQVLRCAERRGLAELVPGSAPHRWRSKEPM